VHRVASTPCSDCAQKRARKVASMRRWRARRSQ
jgi:hypothetical protein